ncbi:hypothetical protein MPL3356_340179 [Mesorhizobium plurifarium]|uniref:Uncharacterized protein n=1 Tax=Mesorhizobium plurifarium TaxID=69974 RepID=A0A090FQ74_MESPL|nr:hypothetical protein MPL3356_340179 [Mesorhizobium plurifarium]
MVHYAVFLGRTGAIMNLDRTGIERPSRIFLALGCGPGDWPKMSLAIPRKLARSYPRVGFLPACCMQSPR